MIITDNNRLLMDAALPLFAQNGFHKTKVSDIVKKAGVAQGTFYWHFKNKEAIVVRLLEDGERNLLDVIHSGYRKQVGSLTDMVASSEQLMFSLFTYAKTNCDYMQLLFKTGQDTDKQIRTQIKGTFVAIEAAFASNIARAQELHMLSTRYASQTLAAMLSSLVFGMLERWLFRPESDLSEMTPNELAKVIVSFEFFGLQGLPLSQS
ncbi:AcrR family transcriptional regulator [Alkalihalobacillus xiaoxiensis]|uniref:AcrR family transcriptional regulator n=1 Tax=Shouchella xiaoxiensis TaxID=766895 RepID=A0ABS2SP99_9BACI|nr:TetR/AcrR family transcriptional regulator [Shouchella xiaoxiensis]MBM7837347.1 AcrR family transcriptional regulator [Shouchella xiaoxiensis]